MTHDPFDEPMPRAELLEPIEAILIDSPPAPQKPRIWTAITVPLLAITLATIASGVFLTIAMLASGHSLDDPDKLLEVVADIVRRPWGIFLLTLPGQLSFLFCALVPAYLSPLSITSRLDLKRGYLPIWTWILVGIGTPAVGFLTSLLMNALNIQMSEQLEMINDMVVGRKGWGVLVTVLLVAIIPGFVEELLFRGYLQSRLLKRWKPWTAITVSAAIFALAHLDPLHVLAVFPIGLWLGYVAWKAGSIWPAVMGHFANNGFAIAMAQFQAEEAVEQIGLLDVVVLAPSAVAILVSILVLRSQRVVSHTNQADV